ncbi:MAG: hypothetical protein OEU09_20855, partial [Rhodospirillales bacterium]|nr:hypothetical protein [Rhodospirillales bacterium]
PEVAEAMAGRGRARVRPLGAQYERDNSTLYRDVEAKPGEGVGRRRTRKILRNNVIVAFRRPSRLR